MENKNSNLIVAAVAMIAFLALWQHFVVSRYRTPLETPPTAAEKAKAGPTPMGLPTDLKSAVTEGADTNKETLTTLNTPDAKVLLLSRGARVASWQLKEREHWIELVEPEKDRTISPLETFGNLNFAVKKVSETEAVFSAQTPEGLHVEKTIRLLSAPPFHNISIRITNPTKQEQTFMLTLPWGNGLDKHEVGQPYDPKSESVHRAEMRAVALAGESHARHWKPGVIFGKTINVADSGSKFRWIGVDNNHFLAVFLAGKEPIQNIAVRADKRHAAVVGLATSQGLKPGETWQTSYDLYVGPKEYDQLEKLGNDLQLAVDFGFFGMIAKGLLKTLNFFESLTGNYGWAIIMLTLCIQLLVFPLTRKNLQFSVRMRELQPQLKKLQEQFKSDPKRLQVETFNLYRKNGMKFMGMEGCFPMMLQLPIFFAFYSTLHVAYELRGAPWILWIHDLGAYDPKYILPIIMGIGMFVQQKLTAATMDPAQARMMMFMPIMFTFMFLKLPAGLVLYWCVNSIATIVIQKILQWRAASNSPNPQPA